MTSHLCTKKGEQLRPFYTRTHANSSVPTLQKGRSNTMVPYPKPGLHRAPPQSDTSLQQESPLLNLTKAADEVLRAHTTKGNLYQTPLRKSSLPGSPILKLESEQITGSFKARGALNKLHGLRTKGVVAASTGNHALAIAHASRVYNQHCTIFISCATTESKKRRLENTGVEIIVRGENCLSAELAARAYAEERGLVYVSPYNDLHVAAGQGTVAYELLRQLGSAPRTVYTTVGGGGLVASMAVVLKPLGWRIVACQPERSGVMLRCVEAGRVVDVDVGETICDGSAGEIEEGCVTLPYCAQLVDSWVVVTEEEISAGVERMEDEGLFVEGAAAAAVAGYLGDVERVGEGVIIVCGGNVDC